MDDNNELIIYVLRQLRYGVPEPSIRETLIQNGWPMPLVDRAFAMVQQSRPHDVPPSTQPSPSQPLSPEVNLPTTQPASVATGQPEMLRPSLPKRTEPGQKPSNLGRRLIVALLVSLAMLSIGFGAYLLYKANTGQDPKPTTTQNADVKDSQRKKDIRALAAALSAYYSAHQTYPTISQINDDGFASVTKGFPISKFKDPGWNSRKASCKNEKGSAIFSAQRTEYCYSYRPTAANGGDCDAGGTPCSRVVLTANLDGNNPFIIALDRNRQE